MKEGFHFPGRFAKRVVATSAKVPPHVRGRSIGAARSIIPLVSQYTYPTARLIASSSLVFAVSQVQTIHLDRLSLSVLFLGFTFVSTRAGGHPRAGPRAAPQL